MDEPHGPQRLNRPGSECSARVLAEALSKIAPSNEADTQSILGNFNYETLMEILKAFLSELFKLVH